MSPRLSERYCGGIVALLDTLFVGYIQTASPDYSILSFIPPSADSFHSLSVLLAAERQELGKRRRAGIKDGRKGVTRNGAGMASFSLRGYLFKQQLCWEKMVACYLENGSDGPPCP